MQRDFFEMTAMDRKLSSIVSSNNGRRKSKAIESARSSRNKNSESSRKHRSISRNHPDQECYNPLSNECIARKRRTVKLSAQTQRQTASHTIAMLDSKVTEVGQELQAARTANEEANSAMARLRSEKEGCQTEMVRLQQQLRMMSKSHASMVELNDSLTTRLSQAQHELELERCSGTEREEALLRLQQGESAKRQDHESQMLELKRLLEKQQNDMQTATKHNSSEKRELERKLEEYASGASQLEQSMRTVERNLRNTESQLESTKKEREQLTARLQESDIRRAELEQRCRQLEQRCRELEQALSASQNTSSELQRQLHKERQRSAQMYEQAAKIEGDFREAEQAETARLRAEHKEQLTRLEQLHLLKLRQVQELANSNLLLKEKEVSLVRATCASEFERLRSQIAQLTLAKGERESQLSSAERKLAEANSQLTAKNQALESLEEKNMEMRLQVEELQYVVSKLQKVATEAKAAMGKEAANRQEGMLAAKEKERRIDALEKQNSQLIAQCDELVGKLEGFCEKVHELETHMQSEALVKGTLETRIRELQSKISVGLKDPKMEQQLASSHAENQQLRRTIKEHKLRQKLSEDKVREMQVELDESSDRYNSQQVELEKLRRESEKVRLLSQQVESANRVSEVNLKGLLKNLQEKEQLILGLKDQLVKEQFRNDLLVTELKALKENHRSGCGQDRCPKNSTPALDQILRERPSSSRRTDLAMRTIDTNAGTEEQRPDKMTI